jgi:molecular chaperone GrpE
VNNPEQDPPEPGGAPPHEPTVEIPNRDLEMVRLKDERDQLEVQLQRTLADTANMRRRQKQEMDDSKRRVLEGLTQELLPVLDTFGAALQAYDAPNGGAADPKSLVDGVRLVRTMLSGALERHGLQEIRAEGAPFDPKLHDAVTVEPTSDVPEGHVVRVLQPGYLLGDRVVRHSRVTVAGNPTPPKDN